MNIRRIVTATLLSSCFVCFSRAEDRPGSGANVERQSVATEKSAEMHDLAVSATAKPLASTAAATVNSEVFRSIVVQAGSSVSLDSTLDYSSVSTVAVTVLCAVCTTAATSLGSLGLVLQARWLVLSADSYVATENRAATAFAYWDVGAAVFNVYGSQFRLTLQNKGTQSIAIQQLTIFHRSPSSGSD